ncbi:hypothetical protein Tco_0850065 [Tanacetum coccineum]
MEYSKSRRTPKELYKRTYVKEGRTNLYQLSHPKAFLLEGDHPNLDTKIRERSGKSRTPNNVSCRKNFLIRDSNAHEFTLKNIDLKTRSQKEAFEHTNYGKDVCSIPFANEDYVISIEKMR